MTKEEAKTILQCRGNGYSEDEFNEALEIAYSALDSSLPSNLDEAAEKYSENILANNEDLQDAIEDAFKAGAEWMAGQGKSTVAKIGLSTKKVRCTISEKTLDSLGVRADDEIVIQARKK